MNYVFCGIAMLLFATSFAWGQGSVEAEIDTLFAFQFEPVHSAHHKKVLIDTGHHTIYSEPSGKETVREMLRIIEKDGFGIEFTSATLDSTAFQAAKPDLLIIHGIPNDTRVLNDGVTKEIVYTSPLRDEEVYSIVRYVYKGGGLLLFLSHFPGGSGALPLLEAFRVKFRDGYAYHPYWPGHNCGLCSHFVMTQNNKLLNIHHSVLQTRLADSLLPNTVKFLCGAAVFRNPEDNILLFPNNTTNFTPTTNKGDDVEESSDVYAGMIGFEYGAGRVVICTDQGIFRSLDLLLDGERIPVTIHDPEADNAALFLNILRWLGQLQ